MLAERPMANRHDTGEFRESHGPDDTVVTLEICRQGADQ